MSELQFWVATWLIVAVLLFLRHWRSGRGVGLLLGFVVSFGALDWLASALLLLPWNPSNNLQFVTDGTRLSALAMISVAVGAEVAMQFYGRAQVRRGTDLRQTMVVSPLAMNLCLGIGLVLQVLLSPLTRAIPSVGAIVSSGSTLVVVGVGLKCWDAWHSGRRGELWLWLCATLSLPFFTVITQGFLGYGLAAMMTVFAFVGSFYLPRWRVLVIGVVVAYFGLSVYVTYMRDRDEFRSEVRAGASFSDRVARIQDTASQAELFDLHNESHLSRIEVRLEQNYFVGAAVAKLSSGAVAYADGSTVWDAVLALVPRALWPDKTVSVGSGDLVTRFTGIRFQGETSVGIGELMEFYVNFGTPGVIVGFLIVGALLALIDLTAHARLAAGNIPSYLLWYMPGINLLNVGVSFVDITSAAGAALLLAFGMGFAIRHFGAGVAERAPDGAAMPIDLSR